MPDPGPGKGESWYARDPGAFANGWSELEPEWFSEVRAAQVAEAVRRLQDTSALELSDCDARTLATGPLGAAPGREPYLLRGLVHEVAGAGAFHVYEHQDQVSVFSVTLFDEPVPFVRWPLVALLEAEPETVYVDGALAR